METEGNRKWAFAAYRIRKDGIRQLKEEYERLGDEMKGHFNYEKAKLSEYRRQIGDANFGASATWDMEKYIGKGIAARSAYKKQKELVNAMERQYRAKLNIAKVNIGKYKEEIKKNPFGNIYKPNMSRQERLSILERSLYP